MSHRMIRVDEVEPQAWRNGGGLTRELLAGPNADAWQWRVSVADIEGDSSFSPCPGVGRWFVPTEGENVELTIDGRVHLAWLGDEPLAFDGAALTPCRLLAENTRDLGLVDVRYAE